MVHSQRHKSSMMSEHNDPSTTIITKTILFRCVEISDISTISASGSRKIVHFKGFAERLHSPLQPPSDLIKHLRNFDILAWDGDLLHQNSFTKYLIGCLTDEPTPRLLAYRLRFEEMIDAATDGSLQTTIIPFLDAWNNVIATISSPSPLSNDNVANISRLSFGKASEGAQYDHECIIHYKQLDADPIANLQFENRYLELAIKALKDSGSTAIVCAGGGNGIKAEFDFIQHRLDEEYTWSAWPLTRLTSDNQRVEECFFTQLRGAGNSHAAKVNYFE